MGTKDVKIKYSPFIYYFFFSLHFHTSSMFLYPKDKLLAYFLGNVCY